MSGVNSASSEAQADGKPTPVISENAPAPAGPYTQGVSVAGTGARLVFVSGQLPINLVTGDIHEGSIGEQAALAIRHALAVVDAAGGDNASVVKTTLFVSDISKMSEINEAYAAAFEGATPARTTVEVSRLPKGAQVEIDLIAAIAVGA